MTAWSATRPSSTVRTWSRRPGASSRPCWTCGRPCPPGTFPTIPPAPGAPRPPTRSSSAMAASGGCPNDSEGGSAPLPKPPPGSIAPAKPALETDIPGRESSRLLRRTCEVARELAAEIVEQTRCRPHALEEMIQPQVLVGAVLAIVRVGVGHEEGGQLQDIGEGPDRDAASRGRHHDRLLAALGPLDGGHHLAADRQVGGRLGGVIAALVDHAHGPAAQVIG